MAMSVQDPYTFLLAAYARRVFLEHTRLVPAHSAPLSNIHAPSDEERAGIVAPSLRIRLAKEDGRAPSPHIPSHVGESKAHVGEINPAQSSVPRFLSQVRIPRRLSTPTPNRSGSLVDSLHPRRLSTPTLYTTPPGAPHGDRTLLSPIPTSNRSSVPQPYQQPFCPPALPATFCPPALPSSISNAPFHPASFCPPFYILQSSILSSIPSSPATSPSIPWRTRSTSRTPET